MYSDEEEVAQRETIKEREREREGGGDVKRDNYERWVERNGRWGRERESGKERAGGGDEGWRESDGRQRDLIEMTNGFGGLLSRLICERHKKKIPQLLFSPDLGGLRVCGCVDACARGLRRCV